MTISVTYIYEQGRRCGYEATDGIDTVFVKHSAAKARKLLTRKRWERAEQQANRYIVDWRTGEIIYAKELSAS